MTRRSSVSIDAIHADDVCTLIVPTKTAIQKKLLVDYGPLKFKNALKWEMAKPYRHVIRKVLELTNGKNVHQLSLLSLLKAWDGAGEYENTALEHSSYAVRAMISQLANHKKKRRPVPREQKRFWQV